MVLPAALAAALTWTPTAPLPDGYSGHVLVASGGSLYNIGGVSWTNGILEGDRVFAAAVQPDGGLSSWSTTTPLPEPVFYHAGAASGPFVYVLGGYHYAGGIDVSNVVYYAKRNADGTLGAWTATTPLPQPLFFTSAAVWNGRIYIAGGWNGSALSNAVYSALVGADGALGPWVAQRALPEGVYTHATVSDGTLYVLGGVVNGGTQLHNTVYAAAIGADGTLQPWATTTPLPQPVANHGAIVASGRVYVLGGWTGSAQTADVVSAASSASGLGDWAAEAPLPRALYLHGVAVSNGRVYVSGGADPSVTTNAVSWSPLPPPSTPPPPPPPADQTAPVTTLAIGQPQSLPFVSPATPFSLSANDGGSGVQATYWAVDGGSAAAYSAPFSLPEGAHWLSYYSVDKAGNTEAVHLASAAVDGTAPASTLSASPVFLPSDGGAPWLGAASALALTGADPVVGGAASGVARSEYAVDGGAAQAATATFTLPEGAHAVAYRSVDNVGNAEPWRSYAYRVDATPPATTLTVSGTATTLFGLDLVTPSSQISLAATDAGSGVKTLSYAVDAGADQAYAGPFSLPAGAHAVAFGAADHAGNAEPRQTASVTVGTLLADAVAASQSIALSGNASVSGNARAPSVTLAGNAAVSGAIFRVDPGVQADLAAARAYAQAHNAAASSGPLALSGKQTMTLAAGVYLFDGLSLSGQASLTAAAGVQIFLTGPLSVTGQAELNAAGSADDLWIFSDAASVSVAGGGRAAFHLYAPLADVSFTGGGQIAGRVYGRTVNLAGGAVMPSASTLPPLSRGGRSSGPASRPQPEPVASSGSSFIAAPAPPVPSGESSSRGKKVAATRPPSLPVAPKAAFGVVTGEGRTVRSVGGPGVVVPPGALTSGLGLTVSARAKKDAVEDKRRDDARARRGLAVAGDAVEFGPEGTRFEKPVTIELPFDPKLLPAGAALNGLAVNYWNPQSGEWEPLASIVDARAGIVSAQTSHFSLYQVVFGGAPASSGSGAAALSNAYAYPNPARRGARPVIRAEAAGVDSVEFSVYDISGELRQRASAGVAGGAAEYAVDVSGLGSGVYLFVVNAGGQRRSGRLAVIK